MSTRHNQLLFYSAIIILSGVLLTTSFYYHKKVKKLKSYHESILKRIIWSEKFSRLGAKEIKRVSGTGLGIFIVREIVEKHGGKIWFEPKEKGNEFIVELKKRK